MPKHRLVSLYAKIVKYPPACPKRGRGAMRITHHTKRGTIIYECVEYITPDDLEKLYVLLYLSQHQEVKKLSDSLIISSVHIHEIRKMTRCHNDQFILNSLKRMRSLTVTSISRVTQTVLITGLIHEVVYDMRTGWISVTWNYQFYVACLKNSWRLNLSLYVSLSRTAKNLYSFLSCNSGSLFSEDMLMERIVLRAHRRDVAKRSLIKALDELKDANVVQGYEIRKDGYKLIHIQRHAR